MMKEAVNKEPFDLYRATIEGGIGPFVFVNRTADLGVDLRAAAAV